jgi:protein TonB
METPDDKVYNKTETRPGYRAGKQEMARHINETLIYPALAKEIGRQGVVHISFVIELDGSISNPAVTRGVQWQMNAEALRVVKTLGAFNPGTIGGAPVRTRVTLPIRFVLQE